MSSASSDHSLYLRAAEDLRSNERQWQAYQSTGHCVLLAGPGSGKTKTLTIKLARMLNEDVDEPRGIACITYNNECARELENRLEALGIAPGGRVFIGTVHSFSLTQILLPYAKVAGLGLPDSFTVANRQQARAALAAAHANVIGGPENPQNWEMRLGRHRRRFLNRELPEWQTLDPQLTAFVEAYEAELRAAGLIDFDDMPLLAVRALAENRWLRTAMVAKYPILAVDEYQDLGRALHRMVMGLCFSAGMRLFAVGDVDQSIYGFTGATPELLRRLSERDDVETLRLGLNYRCGSRIVSASEYVLGEERGYEAPHDAHEGTVYFHPCTGGYAEQARYLIEELIPEIRERRPDINLGEIAALYPAAFLGNELANAAAEHGYSVIRTDGNALYPRGSKLMRWLEQCAMWCCGGWRSGAPRLSRVVSEGARLFHEAITDEDERLAFQRDLTAALWDRRDETVDLHDWLTALHDDIIRSRVSLTRSLDDEYVTLNNFLTRIGPAGDVDDFPLAEFAGIGSGLDRINLSTLHSAKGREFDVVILFGAEEGRLPRNYATENDLREARRLFYVGFTRARHEIHLMYGQHNPSRFVTEVQDRLEGE
ncbi:ATP-dependent DNA helicase Rep [Caenispirillum salinarum AK4]|uniref:DNA 3'-5' helicase n=1 Tax=Caenispirillum salinarum AK4 TaxID=1238182 RepID=K9H7L3_9PROT|nr:ATP-dependent helicase [Caenispirillum salinarum]EKV26578.1 ATP-dependent DNA helicase Rep [Caenispirillum salinarum AK4]